MEPQLLAEVVEALRERLPPDFDLLFTPEAMGIPLAAGLSLAVSKPYCVARKRSYGLPGEIEVSQRTGYSEGRLFVHGLAPGRRVVIVDDVVSTGGTLRAMAAACKEAHAELLGTLVVINKDLDLARLAQEVGSPVRALVRLRIDAGRVVLLETP